EVMSIVALEAAAMGTPVLLTDRCGFDEVAEIGGGLVVPADQGALAHGLATMLCDLIALQGMGERLRSFVLSRYAWPTVARQLLERCVFAVVWMRAAATVWAKRREPRTRRRPSRIIARLAAVWRSLAAKSSFVVIWIGPMAISADMKWQVRMRQRAKHVLVRI